MDLFSVNAQIEEVGYIIIDDLSEDELAELFESMIAQESAS